MDMFVGKPVSPERLAETIRAVLVPSPMLAPQSPPIESVPPSISIVDPAILRDDFAMLGPERANRMVEAFRRDGPERLNDLMSALKASDCVRVSTAAHALKSAASQLGLVGLAARCQMLEEQAKQNDIVGMTSVSSDVAGLFEESRAYVEKAARTLTDTRQDTVTAT